MNATNSHHPLTIGCAILLSAAFADEPTEKDRARIIFDAAVGTHRAMHASKDSLEVTIQEHKHAVGFIDHTTTGTIERKWRHECRTDYATGVLISETYRTSEKFDDVEQVDFPRAVLSYRLCADCELKSIRQSIPNAHPSWSDIESHLTDDTKLIDPLSLMDRTGGSATADFLDQWKESYIDPGTLVTSVHESPDGSAIEVDFVYVEGAYTYHFTFERDVFGTRLTGLATVPAPGAELQLRTSQKFEWRPFTSSDGRTIILPTLSRWFASEQIGPTTTELRAEDWKVSPTATEQTVYEEHIATRSALIAYDGMASRLEVERWQREQIEATPAP